MHPRISVHGFCGSRSTLSEDIEFWRGAGIDRVGIPMPKIDDVPWDHGIDREHGGRDGVVSQILDAGLDVCHLTVVKAFDLSTPADWDWQRQAVLEVIDLAGTVSAERLCLTAGPAGLLLADDAARAFAEALGPVKKYAQDRNIPIALEHNHVIRRDLGFLSTLKDAVAYAQVNDIKVCAEVQNFWVEYDLGRTITSGVDVIDLVQISDWVQTDSMIPPNRAALGDGDIPLERIISMFLKAGYQGVFDIELVGPRIDAQGYQQAVVRSIDWLTDTLDRLGA